MKVPLRVAVVNTEDLRGGAARAAYRLHQGLRSSGVDSTMLVQVRQGDDFSVSGPPSRLGNLLNTLRPAIDLAPILVYRRRNKKAVFYPGWLPDSIVHRINKAAPDLVHLHWITGGFVNVRSLRRLALPLVWTVHDMWAFTGGCHYDAGCGRYASNCGHCPVLGSSMGLDLSRLGWARKKKAYGDLNLSIVAPSRWLASETMKSSLLGRFPVHVIPNGIDTDLYRPLGRELARELLRLPKDRMLILFGAMGATSDPRKGFSRLQDALKRLAVARPELPLTAMIFGASAPKVLPDLGMPVLYAGNAVDDLTLAAIYSSADVFVAPSSQENLSNTVMEALSCGTPCVAFDVGGMSDMIDHRDNGFLAKPFDSVDLADGICWAIADDFSRRHAAERARRKVLEKFGISRIAQQHAELYAQLLERAG